jgi:peptide/nickel transport system substrate-binding protein
MITKRFGALLAVLGLALSACGTAGTASPTAGTPTSTPATGATSTPAASASASSALTPKDGGTLVVAIPGDIAFADPALISDGNSSYVMDQVVQGLVGLKSGTVSDIIPVLASALPTVSTDGKTYTFTLRTGVKFHDGTDFNADAVVYNYNRWDAFKAGDLQTNAYYYGAVFNGFGTASNIASVMAPDESTVVFNLKQPQSNFLISQTNVVFGIESPTALKNENADLTPLANNKYAQGQAAKNMVGTGPFMFKEWVPKDHITLVKNPNYWDPTGVAHLDQIVFKPIADETSVLQSLQSGDVDMAQVVAPADVKTIQGNNALAVIDRGQSCNIGQISMNQDGSTSGADDPAGHTLMANKDIRLAIAYAVNKPSYITAFYAGQATPADNWMPPATQYYKPENLPTYDLQKAKDMITASGVPASSLVLDFYYPSNVARPYMPDPKGLAEAIAQDLTAVGFTITFKTEDWGTYLTDESAGKFPMWLLGWTCDWAGADNFLDTAFFHYVGGKPSTEFAYKNDQLNSVMNQALAATDPTQIASLWQQAQDLIAADMPTVPLVNSTPPGAEAAYVEGFVGAGNLTENFNSVWLNK